MPYLDWMGNTIGNLGSPGTRMFQGRPNTLGTLGAAPVNTFDQRFAPAMAPGGLVYPGQFNEAPPVPTQFAPPVTPRYEELNQPGPVPPPGDDGGFLARALAGFKFRPAPQIPQASPFAFTGRPAAFGTIGGGQRGTVNQLFRPPARTTDYA